ncbi:MAG: HAD-IIIA family hydrolase [Deltaproteobacteria bacterium]|nr:HAD-IIIA family hydrolase [Deltaproteobacteria bacterium]
MREQISRIKLVLFDVDGVLTDGRITIDNNGVESKAFDVKDGHGLKLLQRGGFRVGLITGRESRIVEYRAAELGIGLVYQGVKEKLPVFERIGCELRLEDSEIAYVGDDLVDLPVLRRAGFSATVADGCELVKPEVDYVARCRGGRGAVREICELLLRESGRWSEVLARYS